MFTKDKTDAATSCTTNPYGRTNFAILHSTEFLGQFLTDTVEVAVYTATAHSRPPAKCIKFRS